MKVVIKHEGFLRNLTKEEREEYESWMKSFDDLKHGRVKEWGKEFDD